MPLATTEVQATRIAIAIVSTNEPRYAYVVVPFKKMPFLAHTMLSFGFEGDEYLAISAEVRTEKNEEYNPLLGLLNQYELTYVVADERARSKTNDAGTSRRASGIATSRKFCRALVVSASTAGVASLLSESQLVSQRDRPLRA